MSETLSPLAAEAVAPGRDAGSAPPAWAERSVRALEVTLESGHLDWVSRMLGDARTASVLALKVPALTARIHAARVRLTLDRERETVLGPGSLIDQGHPLTHLAARARAKRLPAADPN